MSVFVYITSIIRVMLTIMCSIPAWTKLYPMYLQAFTHKIDIYSRFKVLYMYMVNQTS